MPPRYTIRQVVGTYRRKAFGTCNDDGSPRRPSYPPDAIVAFYGTLELAEEQPTRGHFESERLLRVLLEGPDGKGRRFARRVPFLIAQGDLVPGKGGGLDVEGWDILQEGDTTIADRVARFRSRKRNAPANGGANGGANDDVTADVTEDPRARDDARDATRPQRRGDGYEEEGTTPLPPTSGGRRANGTNPRKVAAEITRRANAAEAERKARRRARHLACHDGRITEAQRFEMDERDAPLEEIPAERGAAFREPTPTGGTP